MKAAVRGIFVLLAGLLLGAGSAAPGATVYINRVVLAQPGAVPLAALVRTTAAPDAGAQGQLSRSVTVLADAVQYVPVTSYAELLESAFGADAIIVGSWSLVVPRGTSAEAQPYLLDRLADFLAAQGLLGDERTDLVFALGSSSGASPRDGTPSFQVVKTSRGAEVSFQLTGSAGGSVAGSATLLASAAAPATGTDSAASALRGSSVVRVVFRKGPITVEMPGRVVSGGAVGQTATVYIPDSQKTFTGRVLDGKAVQVDLP